MPSRHHGPMGEDDRLDVTPVSVNRFSWRLAPRVDHGQRGNHSALGDADRLSAGALIASCASAVAGAANNGAGGRQHAGSSPPPAPSTGPFRIENQRRATGHGARVVHPPTAAPGAVAKRSLLSSFLELSPESTSSQAPRHQWSRLGAVQSAVTGPGSQTQYLSACGVIPGTSFRSPEGNANAICDPPVCTANWHTCPAGAAHRKVTVCWAALLGVCRRRQTEWRRDAKRRR